MTHPDHQNEYALIGYLSSLVVALDRYEDNYRDSTKYDIDPDDEVEFFDFMAKSIIDNQHLWSHDYSTKPNEGELYTDGVPDWLLRDRISNFFSKLISLRGCAPVLLIDLFTRTPSGHIISLGLISGLKKMNDSGRGFYLPGTGYLESNYLDTLESSFFHKDRRPLIISEKGYVDNDDYLRLYIHAIENYLTQNPDSYRENDIVKGITREDTFSNYIRSEYSSDLATIIDNAIPHEVAFSNHVRLETFSDFLDISDKADRTTDQERKRVASHAHLLRVVIPNIEIGHKKRVNHLAGKVHPLAKASKNDPNLFGKALLSKLYKISRHTSDNCQANGFTKEDFKNLNTVVQIANIIDSPERLFVKDACQIYRDGKNSKGSNIDSGLVIYSLSLLHEDGYDLNEIDSSGSSLMDDVRLSLKKLPADNIANIEHGVFQLTNNLDVSDNNSTDTVVNNFSI